MFNNFKTFFFIEDYDQLDVCYRDERLLAENSLDLLTENDTSIYLDGNFVCAPYFLDSPIRGEDFIELTTEDGLRIFV